MKLLLFVILYISISVSSYCQAIQFKSKINQDHFIFTSADTIEIKVLKFYIANLQFWRNGKLVQTDKKRAYLIDVLNNTNSDQVTFSFADANSSCLITIPTNVDYKYVVMPMRI